MLGFLAAAAGTFLLVLIRDLYKYRDTFSGANPLVLCLSGFIANFFDTLGIGSFAQLTAIFKLFRLVPDRVIPGTLNVSCCIPVVVEAFIFMTIISVELVTLISLLAAAVTGSIAGTEIVAKLPEKKVQLCMGTALLLVAIIIISDLLQLMPLGGEASVLSGGKLVLGVIGNFVLGALMTIGVGLFAPCMALIYLLGLSPEIAFPIMMGSCAFVQPAASIKFIKAGAYDRKASLWITIAGTAGVLIAAFIFKSLPLFIMKWLIAGIIIYTGITMLKAAFQH